MASISRLRLIILIAFFSLHVHIIRSATSTDSGDVAALKSLKDSWKNTPPSWNNTDDPCASWEGVSCTYSRVTALGLSTIGLVGTLSAALEGSPN